MVTAGNSAFYPALLRRIAPNFESFTLGIDDVARYGPFYWVALEGLATLKDLSIITQALDDSFDGRTPGKKHDMQATYFKPLLEIVSNLDTFEELALSDSDTISEADRYTAEVSVFWPFALKRVTSKVVAISVDDGDLARWADYSCLNLREVLLMTADTDATEWKKKDFFPGLRRFILPVGMTTKELLTFPLRDLKEIRL